MKKAIEFDEQCPACGGSGLYVGMGERNGAAVVCHKCKGTGCHKYRYEFEPFSGRVDKPDVIRVYQTNPGICIGTGNGHTLEEFGGMPIKEWESGLPFPKGSENRKFTCPCWWYQSADYDKKPKWKECDGTLGKSFSQCEHFSAKSECWKRFDKEQEAR